MSYTITVEALRVLLQDLGIYTSGLENVFINYGLLPSERYKKRLLWRDDMEDYTVMRWIEADGSPTTTLNYVNAEIAAFEGDYVLKFFDTVQFSTAIATRYFGPLPLLINSFEVRWWRTLPLQQMEFFLVTQPRTGLRYYGALRWNVIQGCWQYRDSAYIWHDIEGTNETIFQGSWNYMRMVVDFQNLHYHRLISNGLDVDLSTLAIPLQVATTAMEGLAYAGLRGRHNAANSPCYVDDARIYLNEAP